MHLIPPARAWAAVRDLLATWGVKRIVGCMPVVVSDTLSLRFVGRDYILIYTPWTLDLSAARPPDALIVAARCEDRQGEVSLRAWVVARRAGCADTEIDDSLSSFSSIGMRCNWICG